MAPVLAALLDDPYDAVRHLAAESLAIKPGFETFEYDYIAPADTRTNARAEAMALWDGQRTGDDGAAGRSVPVGSGRSREAVLIDHRGQSKQDRVERYLSLRDDRPIFRQE